MKNLKRLWRKSIGDFISLLHFGNKYNHICKYRAKLGERERRNRQPSFNSEISHILYIAKRDQLFSQRSPSLTLPTTGRAREGESGLESSRELKAAVLLERLTDTSALMMVILAPYRQDARGVRRGAHGDARRQCGCREFFLLYLPNI